MYNPRYHMVRTDDFSLDQLRDYTTSLYSNSDRFDSAQTWFDKKGGDSFARRPEPEMTPKKYFDNASELFKTSFILDRQEYYDFGEMIQLSSFFVDVYFDDSDVNHLFWFRCPYNPKNFEKMNELFVPVAGKSIDDLIFDPFK